MAIKMKPINIENWNRKEHFEFFSSFEDPYFSITAHVEANKALERSKAKGDSFFAVYLHAALLAANSLTEMRYRIIDHQLMLADEVHASPTIGRADGTFGFGFIPFHADFEIFAQSLAAESQRVKNSQGLCLNLNTWRADVVHCSSLPWLHFNAVTHPRKMNALDSVPKITFGKCATQNKQLLMPVSVYAHHGLMDGWHVAQFFSAFQEFLNQ
jgi:chloramphenicol O-acetyltransferase type A